MNTLRKAFKEKVDALVPVLREAYRSVRVFRSNRTEHNGLGPLRQIGIVGENLQFLKPMIPTRKQLYFDAILSKDLLISDRIVALDISVGSMHIAFPVKRAYMHRETEELRGALVISRMIGAVELSS